VHFLIHSVVVCILCGADSESIFDPAEVLLIIGLRMLVTFQDVSCELSVLLFCEELDVYLPTLALCVIETSPTLSVLYSFSVAATDF